MIDKILPLPKLDPITISGVPLFQSINDNLVNDKIKKRINESLKIYRSKFKHKDFPMEDLVGELTNFDLIYTDENCKGYFSLNENQIGLNPLYKDSQLKILSHEIGHHIQYDLEVPNFNSRLLSGQLLLEQQCQTIAYYLYNGMNLDGHLDVSYFMDYFYEDDVLDLANHYGDYVENDLPTITAETED